MRLRNLCCCCDTFVDAEGLKDDLLQSVSSNRDVKIKRSVLTFSRFIYLESHTQALIDRQKSYVYNDFNGMARQLEVHFDDATQTIYKSQYCSNEETEEPLFLTMTQAS